MSESSNRDQNTSKRERSPSFPYINLEKALERAKLMDENHKKFLTSLPVVATTWELGPKSSALLQTVATLKAYGLIDEEGRGKDKKLAVSDLARTIIHDARPGTRESAIKQAVLNPKLFKEFFDKWGVDRPSDSHCISELKLDRGFTDDATKTFLRIFDDNIQFSGLTPADKNYNDEHEDEYDEALAAECAEIVDLEESQKWANSIAPSITSYQVRGSSEQNHARQENERELITGLLSKQAAFRLIVSGPIGVKEIDRLIAKLELEKDILAE